MPGSIDSALRMGKRARAKQANRRAILEAARMVFARIGYDAANIRDIIRETNLYAAFGAYFSFLADENNEAIEVGTPHMSLIGVRIDTPEMQSISDEIAADLEIVMDKIGLGHLDIKYITAAAIGMAREMGDQMLERRPLDPEGATTFAAKVMLAGIEALAKSDH